MKKELSQKLYSSLIALLALASIALAALDLLGKISLTEQPFMVIDSVILLIFTADYAVRFFRADDRKTFFRENLVDLIAIIPFSSLFSVFRLFRMFRALRAARLLKFTRLLRFGAFTGVLRRRIGGILHTNGLIYVIYANAVLIFGASVVMMYAENMEFQDALWWSFVTCTTVGYGDISPASALGRVIAVVLMIFGIGLIGMLTGAITTYFTKHASGDDTQDHRELEELIASATPEEREKLLQIAKIMMKK